MDKANTELKWPTCVHRAAWCTSSELSPFNNQECICFFPLHVKTSQIAGGEKKKQNSSAQTLSPSEEAPFREVRRLLDERKTNIIAVQLCFEQQNNTLRSRQRGRPAGVAARVCLHSKEDEAASVTAAEECVCR